MGGAQRNGEGRGAKYDLCPRAPEIPEISQLTTLFICITVAEGRHS